MIHDENDLKSITDKERWGDPKKRNKGRIQVTRSMLFGGYGLPLPRMTRIIGIVGIDAPSSDDEYDDVLDLIVESPDIPSSVEYGILPFVELEVKMHSVSKDTAASMLNHVEYVVVSAWKDMPHTKTPTPMFAGKINKKELTNIVTKLENTDSSGVFSPAFQALKSLDWQPYDHGVPRNLGFSSWQEAVASLDEAQARNLCATMLESFWGKIKEPDAP